jgi:2-oxoglutarate ferredoxin oxidoreductase subunit beta
VARTTSFHVKELGSLIKKAAEHKGFSVLEVMVQCPTYFGRKNRIGGAVEMLEYYRDHTAPLGSKKLEENPRFIPRGVFREEIRPEYCDEYAKMVDTVREA